MHPSEHLAQHFLERHPDAAADTLAALMPVEIAAALTGLGATAAAALLARLPALSVARTLEHLPLEQGGAILAGFALREAMDVLRRCDPERRERYLVRLPPRTVKALRAGLAQLQDSVAALMDTQVRSYALDSSVGQVRAQLEQEREDPGCHLYLTDGQGRFAGVLPLRLLLIGHPHSRLGSLPRETITVLPEGARSDSVLGHPAWLRHTRLPVVDAAGHFVGALRRERLAGPTLSRTAPDGAAPGMVLSFLDGYVAANAVLLELLMRGIQRRD